MSVGCLKMPSRTVSHYSLRAYMIITILGLLFSSISVIADDLPSCLPKDFHYEYTQCDSSGGRWRVSVPLPNTCTGGAPNAPVRGQSCDFACKSGEFLDIASDQECIPCPAGSYSMGGGVRYDDWEALPTGFSVQVESFSVPEYFAAIVRDGSGRPNKNCSGAGWVPKGKYIASDLQDCTGVLVYSANLVKAGTLTFSYQYENEEILLSFEIQNSQCQTMYDQTRSTYLPTTEADVWKTKKYDLKSGVNVFFWRAFSPTASSSKRVKPALIQNIAISGVAYMSECTKCKAGMYSNAGSSFCSECPANTYSEKGAVRCSPCNSEQYSELGSPLCRERPPCTADDYYIFQSPCSADNTTRKIYKWIEPKLCRDDLSQAVHLPPEEKPESCPPCNPGMEFDEGVCRFCEANHYSDGNGACRECPGSTAPETGLLYKWWNNLPADANVTGSCLSENDRGCASRDGWVFANDHVHSGKGHSDDVYLVLSLHVSGFRGKEGVVDGRPVPIGKISFVFETECTEDCSFVFMQRTVLEGTILLESWSGSLDQTHHTYNVTTTAPITFGWAFQKRGGEKPDIQGSGQRMYRNDVARIYLINVTNTLIGGAEVCKSCPKGASQDGCIPCQEGNYVDPNTTQCRPCPVNTIARGLNPWGVESCTPCGEGLVPFQHSRCVTTCRYSSSDGQEYDFTPLARLQEVEGSHLFTASGYKYYRLFNISLCSGSGAETQATCASNASHSSAEAQQDLVVQVSSPICRSTILPSNPGDTSPPVSVQPLSLSDVLVAITDKGDVYNITEKKKDAGLLAEDKGDSKHDVHFLYVSDTLTSACRHGRTTIVTMRCDLSLSGEGVLELPPRCPDGTCDGCTYLFLWRSKFACPRCKADNYTEIVEQCNNGKQKIMRIRPKNCYSNVDSDETESREQHCSMLWQSHWPIWLKAIVILVPVVIGSGIILLVVVLYCWMQNKKLSYKYMKLVESAGGKDGELPAAETCALDEGEEDEQFDSVEFKKKGNKFFSKFKPSVRKDKIGRSFQHIQLDEKTLLS